MRTDDVAERLRIALITERFGRKFGGAESYAVHLFEKLSRHHDVTVIAREFDHDLPLREVHVKRLKGFPGWMRALHFAYWTRKLTQSDARYDVVHTHAMGPAGDVHVFHVVPLKFRRFFMQSWWRGVLSCLQPRNIAYLWLEASSARSAPGHHVVAVSPSVQDQLKAAYTKLEDIDMIPPGAQPVAPCPETRVRMRGELGWMDSDVGCLLVARNPLRKGLAAVAQAFELLPGHFKLAVVGVDTEARQYLQQRHPELMGRINLLDPVSEVSPYYQAADIYVHPTLRDSFGMAPLEAMAHGLPVVLSSSQYCGFAAFVTHQHDAWVLKDPRDHAEIAQALKVLDPQMDVARKLVRASAALVHAFSWDTVAQRYESLYLNVIRARQKDRQI